MLGLLDKIKKIAASDVNVLIHGEASLGIECIALLVHQHSSRSAEVFLARNCTSIPVECFESEMFGHEWLTSQGSMVRTSGAFLEADHGTLFLDEIGELGYCPQTELFRAIREKAIRPVGSDMKVRVNPRIICACSKDLRERLKDNTFRDDLYYRLATVVLTILPLREQRDVIIPLAHQFCLRAVSRPCALTAEAESRLLAYDWPGNIRELRSTMVQAAVLASGSLIQAGDLKFPMNSVRMECGSNLLVDVERRHIISVINSCRGNKTDAAKALGLARSTLVLKLKAHFSSLASAQ